MAILGLDSPVKKGIFVGYMGLWCALRMLIYGSKKSVPEYNQTTLLIFVCLLKLVIATVMYVQTDGTISQLFKQWGENQSVFLKYFLPAASYVVYDNLTFLNLSLSDPVTYVILMQMRIAATGIIWQGFFDKKLNKNQWISIGLLTAACVAQKARPLLFPDPTKAAEAGHATPVYALLLIAFQIACGVFSSVFNEVLLKEKGGAGVNLQNIFMYTHSLVCNIVWLMVCPSSMCRQQLGEALKEENLSLMKHHLVLPIIFMLASIGIVTSLFIKHLDSVRKTIASAMEIFVDAILAFLLFGIQIGPETVLATCLASAGVYLYAKPVEVGGKRNDTPTNAPRKSPLEQPVSSNASTPQTHPVAIDIDTEKDKRKQLYQ